MAGPVNHRILIVGHGRHGKDTVAEMLRDHYGLQFVSSSEFVGRVAVWDAIGHEYTDFDAMFADRINRRAEWKELIQQYNTPEETRTAREMFEQGYSIYCGMRRREELLAGKAIGLFDEIWWVDRSLYLPPEPESSMTIRPTDADVFINNNGTLDDLKCEVFDAMHRKLYK